MSEAHPGYDVRAYVADKIKDWEPLTDSEIDSLYFLLGPPEKQKTCPAWNQSDQEAA